MEEELKPESIFTVSADPEMRLKSLRIEAHNAILENRRMEAMLKRAGSHPILRVRTFGRGTCTKLGLVVRETPKFYVYAGHAEIFDKPIESFEQKRILKTNAHIEACKWCRDHPNQMSLKQYSEVLDEEGRLI